MFASFSNVWTVAYNARKLGARTPVAITLGGERIALFRDAHGRARALIDRCPHRGVRLSLGTITNGCLTCPFHGWQFDGDGKACVVPFNPDAKLEPLGATALPVEERAGLIWIYTAPAALAAPPPLVLPETFERPSLTLSVLEVVWKTHWTRAMENMLDMPHLPVVHRGTIGRGLVKPLEAGARMDLNLETTATGYVSRMRIDGREEAGSLEFIRPNLMLLRILDTPDRSLLMHVAVVPMDDATTRMFIISARSFLRWRGFDALFALSNGKIAKEDRAVVESSFPREVPPPGDEVSVRTDKLPLLFRKYYFETLRDRAPAVRALPVLQEAS